MGLLCLAISTVFGFVLLRQFIGFDRQNKTLTALLIVLGFGLGTGLGSALFFVLLLALNKPLWAAWLVQALLLCAAFLLFRLKPADPILPDTDWIVPKWKFMLRACVGLALFVSIVMYVDMTLMKPHGDFDAFTVWNLRARFIARADTGWREAFSHQLTYAHTDYPVLLPGVIAQCWLVGGNEWIGIPAMVSFGYMLAVAGLILFMLRLLKFPEHGLIGALLLLCTPRFIGISTLQYADTAVSFFMTAALALLHLWMHSRRTSVLALVGLAAGLAAWTKNEGLLFFITFAFMSVLLVFQLLRKSGSSLGRSYLPAAAGAALPLIALILFKLLLSPPNEVIAAQNGQDSLARLLDGNRYLYVAQLFFGLLPNLGAWTINPLLPLIPYLLVVKPRIDSTNKMFLGFTAVLICAMLLEYYLVFMLSPYDLVWHIGTAAIRLDVQLYPLFVYAMAVVVGPVVAQATKDDPELLPQSN